jgi:hypothetical protein
MELLIWDERDSSIPVLKTEIIDLSFVKGQIKKYCETFHLNKCAFRVQGEASIKIVQDASCLLG